MKFESRFCYRYPCVPGIHTEEQIQGWSKVVQAVKKHGAVFFMQLWHVGRTSHTGELLRRLIDRGQDQHIWADLRFCSSQPLDHAF